MSPRSTSAMSPSEMKCEKPVPRAFAQSRTAATIPPDWATNASLPAAGIRGAKLAFKPECGTMTPKQFGPMIRIRYRPAASSIACRSAWPAAPPPSPKPLLITTAARVPRCPNSSINPGTVSGVVAITARSGTIGSAPTSA